MKREKIIFTKKDIKNISLVAVAFSVSFFLFNFFSINLFFPYIFLLLMPGPIIILIQKKETLLYTLSRLFVGSLVFGASFNILGFLRHMSTNIHILEEAIKMFSSMILFYSFFVFFTGLIAILIKGIIDLCRQKFKK